MVTGTVTRTDRALIATVDSGPGLALLAGRPGRGGEYGGRDRASGGADGQELS
jgi:hypothetical protein